MARRGKKRRKKVLTATAIILLVLAVTGYTASRGFLGERAQDLMGTLFHSAERVRPADELPEGPDDLEPIDPADRAPEEPLPDPGPTEPPVDEPEETPGETPADPAQPPEREIVIYIGQSLIIPVSGAGVEGGPSQVVSKGILAPGVKQIALTFDSGWEFAQTIALLDVLDQYGVTATFFPRALWAEDHPELAREIVRRGHRVGNHSLTHPHMKEFSAEEIRQEMRLSTEIIERITGIRPYLFRPPYGEYNQLVLDILGQEGYPYTIMWTVDTHDWADKIGDKTVTVDYVVDRVLDNAVPNAIMLMHVGGPKTVQALPRIIGGLREMGYSFTTVDKMLPPLPDNRVIHIVKSGDTLYSISRKYGVTVQQIIDANSL